MRLSPRLRRLAVPLSGLALLAPTGCSDVSVNVIGVAVVEVSPAHVTLFEEEEEVVSAVVRSAGGEVLSGRAIRWSTDDPGVAVVSSTGVVRGERRGTTTVRAESGGVVGSGSVTVLQPPTIALSPSEVAFHVVSGADDPPAEEVEVVNEGDGDLLPLSVSVETGGPAWLSASIAAFAAPTTLTVNVTAAGLPPGRYEGSVSVASPAAANSPRSLRVELEVEEAPPEIDLDPPEIVWDILEGGPAPSAEVAIGNRGGGTLEALSASVDYEVGGATGWLEVELSSTTAPSVLAVSLADTDLLPGVHRSAVLIASPHATNSPRSVSIRVRVGPRASPATSTITAEPSSLVANGSSAATITVVLRDARGDPMASGGDGVALSTSAGSLSSITDRGDGTYTAVLTSSTTAGTATITGSVNGEQMDDRAEVQFVPGPPANVAVTAGNNQTGAVGSPLPASLQVRVTDAHGNTVSGVLVQWSTGNGSANPSNSQTASNGRASTTWTLGTTLGSQSLQASVSGAGSVTFNATAEAGPPTAIAITGGNGQTGTVGVALESPLEVEVTDAYGHPVGGVTVTWSPASGSVSPPGSNTGSDGVATTVWTLGTTAGPQALNVSAAGVSGSKEFTATAGPGPVSATRSSVTAEPHEGILAGRVGFSTVTVVLRDLYGNALTGMAGQIQVNLTGQATRTEVVAKGPPGTYAFEVRNDAAELVTVTVTAAGVALADQPVIEFVECCE
jgi:adhesin/invasin